MGTGRHKQNALTTPEMTQLLSRHSGARALGSIRWNSVGYAEGVYELTIPVDVPQDLTGTARLRMGVNFNRPDRVRLAYVVNNVAAYRVCLNYKHNGWSDESHWHRYKTNGGEDAGLCPGFSPVRRGRTVPDGTWKRIFEDFAHRVNVKLPAGYWKDLEGGKS